MLNLGSAGVRQGYESRISWARPGAATRRQRGRHRAARPLPRRLPLAQLRAHPKGEGNANTASSGNVRVGV